MNHQDLKETLNQVTRHGTMAVIVVRLAFVVPYLLQNIVLAMTNLSLLRLMLLTLVGAVPGVVSYSFLGAGLMSLKSTQTFVLLISVPVIILVVITVLVQHLRGRMKASGKQD